MIRENILFLTIFIIFSLSAAIQLFYYLFFYLAPGLLKKKKVSTDGKPVSIIICARNEEENLRKFLPAVLEQDYPDFEVIVVNDCSEDNSYSVLGDLLRKYPRLRISDILKDPKFTHNKKFAQFIGIKAAKNEFLLFTDADCCPQSDKWLEGMVSQFNGETDFVLGYGGYARTKGVLNKYIRYDCMTIAMQYTGMALRGVPYMGVGRNLAYRRSLFFKNRGFVSHTHLVSGDDDLFVNKYATRKNTAVEISSEAHTRSLPPQSFRDLFRQKRRHLTTAHHYKLPHKMILITEPASRVMFLISFIVLLSNMFLWPAVIAIFTARLIAQTVVFSMAQKKFNEPYLLGYSLFFDIFSPFLNALFYTSKFRQSKSMNQWK
jgi:cellulose synthase/poly-beta-1,6-N-acetylglucosamine synthase-like glycosyltransferase